MIKSSPFNPPKTPGSFTSKICLKRFSSKATFNPSRVNRTLEVPSPLSTCAKPLHKSLISPKKLEKPALPVRTAGPSLSIIAAPLSTVSDKTL